MKYILAMALIIFLGGCASTSKHPNWGYSGDSGPEHWAELTEDYKLCSEGKNQSPVNLQNPIKAELEGLELSYQGAASEILNNGHTIQVNIAEGSRLLVDGKTFHLKQFHFHTPSENRIFGQSFPMEVHFVHADAAGNLAVLAVMLIEGEEHQVIQQLWSIMPEKENTKAALGGIGNAYTKLFPKNGKYYRYNGSLTTPPCTEGVRWFVVNQPVAISKTQVEKFIKIMGQSNNRPTQALNARVILK
jgi:carbonic anhydrase